MFGLEGLLGSQMAQNNAQAQLGAYGQQQYYNGMSNAVSDGNSAAINQLRSTVKPKEKIVDNQTIPDISLARVLKWAIVLVVAMALGKKAWGMFGEKITSNLNKALDHADKT